MCPFQFLISLKTPAVSVFIPRRHGPGVPTHPDGGVSVQEVPGSPEGLKVLTLQTVCDT